MISWIKLWLTMGIPKTNSLWASHLYPDTVFEVLSSFPLEYCMLTPGLEETWLASAYVIRATPKTWMSCELVQVTWKTPPEIITRKKPEPWWANHKDLREKR